MKFNSVNMKLLYSVILFFLVLPVNGQTGYQNITDKRIEFLSTKISFTPTEAQQFWPLYREYHQKRELLAENRKKIESIRFDLPDSDYLNITNDYINTKVQEAALFENYYKRYLKIVSAKKIFELYRFEQEFNKNLLRQIKNPPNNNRGKPRN